MKSVFTNPSEEPTEIMLSKALGPTCDYWHELEGYTIQSWPPALKAWHYSGEKYGWSFRISDKKRVLVYLLPRDGFFKVAMVFGQKTTDTILKSDVSEWIKAELRSAKPYAEGRGIRLEVKDKGILEDIRKLIGFKVAG